MLRQPLNARIMTGQQDEKPLELELDDETVSCSCVQAPKVPAGICCAADSAHASAASA